MNELENSGGAAAAPVLEKLEKDLQTLRVLGVLVLGFLIGLSVAGDYYISKQIALQHDGAEQYRRMAAGFPNAAATEFLVKLREYAKTHPDFAPVVVKYQPLFELPVAQLIPPN